MILCASCKNLNDYGNGWVFCIMSGKWIHKGYSKCRAYEEGPPNNKAQPGTWFWVERVKASQEYTEVRTS